MRAILNNKLYDTEKAELFRVVLHPSGMELKIYKTSKGNIFGVNELEEYIVDEPVLKECLRLPSCVDAYIELFGEPEEA